MREERVTEKQTRISKSNRPHCFYLWYLRGVPVCSEEYHHRSCAYPFWNCPARNTVIPPEREKTSSVLEVSTGYSDLVDETGSV